MRRGSVVSYLHGDHLGSTSLTTNSGGNKLSEQRYTPYGATRSGSSPTDRQFTGQRNEIGLGLYDYGARMYDPLLARFLSPDQIVPGLKKPADWNPYTYCRNNPLRYVDPTGYLTDPQIKEWTPYDTDEKLAALQHDHPEIYTMLSALIFGDLLSSYNDKTGWSNFGYAGLDKHGYLQFSFGQDTFSIGDVIAQSSGGTMRLSRLNNAAGPGPAMIGAVTFKGKNAHCVSSCYQNPFALGQT